MARASYAQLVVSITLGCVHRATVHAQPVREARLRTVHHARLGHFCLLRRVNRNLNLALPALARAHTGISAM